MFIVGVASFLTIVFQNVNIAFPDQLDFWYAEEARSLIRGAMASLFVSWPVVIFMSILVGRDLKNDREKKNIWIRKWLLHLLVFAASIMIIIDLITLINTFLNGEITTRFILKVIAILVVGAAVFCYELWEIKRDPGQTSRVPRAAAIISFVVIFCSMIGSFFVIGSPAKQRDLRMDSNRASDLQTIQANIIQYWRDKDQLPENLTLMENDMIAYRNPTDPETGEAYEYMVTDELSFQLCATFATESEGSNQGRYATPVMYDYGYADGSFDVWSHGAGRACFDRMIDPDRYQDKTVY